VCQMTTVLMMAEQSFDQCKIVAYPMFYLLPAVNTTLQHNNVFTFPEYIINFTRYSIYAVEVAEVA